MQRIHNLDPNCVKVGNSLKLFAVLRAQYL